MRKKRSELGATTNGGLLGAMRIVCEAPPPRRPTTIKRPHVLFDRILLAGGQDRSRGAHTPCDLSLWSAAEGMYGEGGQMRTHADTNIRRCRSVPCGEKHFVNSLVLQIYPLVGAAYPATDAMLWLARHATFRIVRNSLTILEQPLSLLFRHDAEYSDLSMSCMYEFREVWVLDHDTDVEGRLQVLCAPPAFEAMYLQASLNSDVEEGQ